MGILHSITLWVTSLVQVFGYAGIAAIIFAESGLLLGLFLPGDSLIFVAGLFAAEGSFNIYLLLAVICIAAALGDNSGYFIGRKLGRRVFEQHNSWIFNQRNLRRTEEFYERYGKRTFLIQRFIPVIRVFAPLLGGVAKMRYRTFAFYDLLGCLFWGISITVLGYYLGAAIPNIDTYLVPAVFMVVVVSLVPTFITYRKERAKRHAEAI